MKGSAAHARTWLPGSCGRLPLPLLEFLAIRVAGQQGHPALLRDAPGPRSALEYPGPPRPLSHLVAQGFGEADRVDGTPVLVVHPDAPLDPEAPAPVGEPTDDEGGIREGHEDILVIGDAMSVKQRRFPRKDRGTAFLRNIQPQGPAPPGPLNRTDFLEDASDGGNPDLAGAFVAEHLTPGTSGWPRRSGPARPCRGHRSQTRLRTGREAARCRAPSCAGAAGRIS